MCDTKTISSRKNVQKCELNHNRDGRTNTTKTKNTILPLPSLISSIYWVVYHNYIWMIISLYARQPTGFQLNQAPCIIIQSTVSHIAKFMGPTWGSPGSCRPQMSPMLAQWTLLLGVLQVMRKRVCGTLCVGNIPWSPNFFSTRKLLW